MFVFSFTLDFYSPGLLSSSMCCFCHNPFHLGRLHLGLVFTEVNSDLRSPRTFNSSSFRHCFCLGCSSSSRSCLHQAYLDLRSPRIVDCVCPGLVFTKGLVSLDFTVGFTIYNSILCYCWYCLNEFCGGSI